ncbi:sensor histidine kinase [Planosporangium mesophilum]|uniref:Histidine kinase n=1 Tax=Planosporangium mesophilum TaxID=689768 RepID=A0A8J3TAP0_9ACTN|nr:histidine kinase [Planosporangium mesophilum]NJC84143.1 sensor histidine kinase [Planosporangium mesophilum]GII22854.1 histidine kinase [Planosporangium mesophilum]
MSDSELRGARFGWIFAAVWLVYLIGTLSALLARPDGWQRDVGLVALAGFAVLYLVVVKMARRVRYALASDPRPDVARIWLGLVAMVVLAALQVPGAGHHALSCLVYVAAFAMVSLPLRQAVPVAAVLAVVGEAAPQLVAGWEDKGYGLAALLGSLAAWGVRAASERQRRLVQAQKELAALAVTNERARIAADLHDILGHSLTVVTVKAELAQRLLDVDLDKARAELSDLELRARDALADVRATAMGVRGISLPGEIAAARSALAAANVTAELPGAAEEVPSRFRELFAWTIREAVTNVVRHSRATRCEVRLSAHSVEIVDDGVGPDPAASDGQGLIGLRRRAEALGASLSAGRRDGQPGFRVRVEVPS